MRELLTDRSHPFIIGNRVPTYTENSFCTINRFTMELDYILMQVLDDTVSVTIYFILITG